MLYRNSLSLIFEKKIPALKMSYPILNVVRSYLTSSDILILGKVPKFSAITSHIRPG